MGDLGFSWEHRPQQDRQLGCTEAIRCCYPMHITRTQHRPNPLAKFYTHPSEQHLSLPLPPVAALNMVLHIKMLTYCGWEKSCTSWKPLVATKYCKKRNYNGINDLPTGAGFLASTVFNHLGATKIYEPVTFAKSSVPQRMKSANCSPGNIFLKRLLRRNHGQRQSPDLACPSACAMHAARAGGRCKRLHKIEYPHLLHVHLSLPGA